MSAEEALAVPSALSTEAQNAGTGNTGSVEETVPSAKVQPSTEASPSECVVNVDCHSDPSSRTEVSNSERVVTPSTIRVVSASAVRQDQMAEGIARATRGRTALLRVSGGGVVGRGAPAIRTGRNGPRVGQVKTIVASARIKKERPDNSKLNSQQTHPRGTSVTAAAPTPKRRRMTSFQHAFLMCGAKAEPVTPQQSKATLMQTSPTITSNRFRPLFSGSNNTPTILGRSSSCPSVVRVNTMGTKKVAPPPGTAYSPVRRPMQKQTVTRILPAERGKVISLQTSTSYPKQLGTTERADLRSSSFNSLSSGDLLSQVKQEHCTSERNNQTTELPAVIARMIQIHAPVSDDTDLPISRPSFLNLQMRKDLATISSNGDVEVSDGSASQSIPALLPTSYTVSVEKKTVSPTEGSDEKGGQVKVRVPPLAPALKCGVFVVKHQEKTGVKLQPVPSLRGDAVAWLDPRGPFEKSDGSRGTGPYLMYARSEDKETNRRRFACAQHGCRVTLTADMDTMLVLRRCGTSHRHENSEADLNKRQIREKLRKRLRLYDGTRTAAEVIREFPELCGVDSEERQRELKKAAVNIRRSPVDGEKISRWGKQVSEVLTTIQALGALSDHVTSASSVDDAALKCVATAIGHIPEVQRLFSADIAKVRRSRKKRKRSEKKSGRGGGRRGVTGGDSLHKEQEEEGEDEFTPESPEPSQGPEVSDEARPIIDTGNSVAAVREEPHRCGECSQAFWAWANLVRHLRVVHKQPIVDCNSARCAECGVVMRATDSEVESHLDFHGYLGNLRFSNMKDVHTWRRQQECEGGRAFVKIREEFNERTKTTMWVCPRRPDVECRVLECEFCPMATTSDPLACPVFIKAIENVDEGSVDVRFTAKHSNACLQWNLTATCFLHSVRRHVASIAEAESHPVILCKDIHQMNEVHPSLLRDDFLAVFCDSNQVRLLSRLTERHSLSIECLSEGIKLTTVALLSHPPFDESNEASQRRPSTALPVKNTSQRYSGNPNKCTLVHVISTAADESSLLAAFSELRRYTGRVRAKVLVDVGAPTRSRCCHSVAREAWRRAMGLGQTELIDPVSLALASAEDVSYSSHQESESSASEATRQASNNKPGGSTLTSSADHNTGSKYVDLSEEVDAVAAALQQDPLRRDLDRLRDRELDASSVLGIELRGAAPADDIQRTLAEACALLADARTSQGVHGSVGSKQMVANGKLALERLKEAIRLLVEPPVREHNDYPLVVHDSTLGRSTEEGRPAPSQLALGVAVNQTMGHVVGHSMLGTAATQVAVLAEANPVITIANAATPSASAMTVTNQVAVTNQGAGQNSQVAFVGGQLPTPIVVTPQTVVPGGTTGLSHPVQVVTGYPTSAAGNIHVQVQGQAWTASQLIPVNHSAQHVLPQPVQIQQQHTQEYLHN